MLSEKVSSGYMFAAILGRFYPTPPMIKIKTKSELLNINSQKSKEATTTSICELDSMGWISFKPLRTI